VNFCLSISPPGIAEWRVGSMGLTTQPDAILCARGPDARVLAALECKVGVKQREAGQP
jgi:hypothetical protein